MLHNQQIFASHLQAQFSKRPKIYGDISKLRETFTIDSHISASSFQLPQKITLIGPAVEENLLLPFHRRFGRTWILKHF
jgi:hypothetical protein